MLKSPYLLPLLIILSIKAALMTALIMTGQIGLGPDEAQYWTWSQYLDWGYYSKPPGIAWQIWLGTKLFGNNELGVRFMSVILSFLLSLSVYALARYARLQPRTAFWAGIVMAFSPLGIMSSLFAITDVGMVLFWSLSSIVMVDALSRGKVPRYYLIGLFLAAGALFKWPIYLFWVLVFCAWPFYRFLINKSIIGGLLISLLGLLPSLFWNVKHEWATFRHVGSTVAGGHAKESVSLFQGNVLDFFGAQAGLLSPIIFILFLMASIYLLINRKEASPAIRFCGFSSILILFGYTAASVFQKMQGNWSDYIYPMAIVFLCWYAFEKLSWGSILVKIGVVVSLLMSIFGLSIPYIQANSLLKEYPVPYKLNPFRQNMGWSNLKGILNAAGYNPSEHFLFGDKYQTSSIVSFYGADQKRGYFLNLHGIRKNQFSFWPGMAVEQTGKTGYFVLPDDMTSLQKDPNERVAFYKGALSQYFKHVEYLGLFPIFDSYDVPVKGVMIFLTENYNGLQPVDAELY